MPRHEGNTQPIYRKKGRKPKGPIQQRTTNSFLSGSLYLVERDHKPFPDYALGGEYAPDSARSCSPLPRSTDNHSTGNAADHLSKK